MITDNANTTSAEDNNNKNNTKICAVKSSYNIPTSKNCKTNENNIISLQTTR